MFTNKCIENTWKNKAIVRRKKNSTLKKRIEELIISRDLWKSKYMNEKFHHKSVLSTSFQKERAKTYKYPVFYMFLVLQFLSYGGASLRSCRHFLFELFFCLDLEMSVPSHSTIRVWICKIGYYNYAKNKPCEDLIILIDESVTLGENKALLVLGFPSSLLNCSRPLQHSDVHLLYFSVGHSWKKEKISEVIRSIQKDYKIVYSISDRGNNLRVHIKC